MILSKSKYLNSLPWPTSSGPPLTFPMSLTAALPSILLSLLTLASVPTWSCPRALKLALPSAWKVLFSDFCPTPKYHQSLFSNVTQERGSSWPFYLNLTPDSLPPSCPIPSPCFIVLQGTLYIIQFVNFLPSPIWMQTLYKQRHI